MKIVISDKAKKKYIEQVLKEFSNYSFDKCMAKNLKLTSYTDGFVIDHYSLYEEIKNPFDEGWYDYYVHVKYDHGCVTVISVSKERDALALAIGRRLEKYFPDLTVEIEDVNYNVV
jgi:hypothetical protein